MTAQYDLFGPGPVLPRYPGLICSEACEHFSYPEFAPGKTSYPWGACSAWSYSIISPPAPQSIGHACLATLYPEEQ